MFKKGPKTDQVFQLSLTELAFIIIFLLMILAGLSIAKLRVQKEEAVERNATAAEKLVEAKIARVEADKTLIQIRQMLDANNAINTDDIITSLNNSIEKSSDRQKLLLEIKDLDAQLSEMVKIEQLLTEAAEKAGVENTQNFIIDAVILKELIDSELNKEEIHYDSEDEIDVVSAIKLQKLIEKEIKVSNENKPLRKITEEVAEALEIKKAVETLLKRNSNDYSSEDVAHKLSETVLGIGEQNSDLRGQVAWLTRKLNSSGGRDLPPCWVDEKTAKIQYLFNVTIVDEGLVVEKGWLPARQKDATALPGISDLLTSSALNLSTFSRLMKGIDEDSRRRECRHYVRLANSVDDLETFNENRFGVEAFFYKYEIREKVFTE